MASLWHVSCLRYFLMFLIFTMFMVAAFDFAIIWSLKVSDESRWPPRYLTLLVHWIVSPFNVYSIPLCFGKLMFSTKVDELCLGFIELELHGINPWLNVEHGVLHDCDGVFLISVHRAAICFWYCWFEWLSDRVIISKAIQGQWFWSYFIECWCITDK